MTVKEFKEFLELFKVEDNIEITIPGYEKGFTVGYGEFEPGVLKLIIMHPLPIDPFESI